MTEPIYGKVSINKNRDTSSKNKNTIQKMKNKANYYYNTQSLLNKGSIKHIKPDKGGN